MSQDNLNDDGTTAKNTTQPDIIVERNGIEKTNKSESDDTNVLTTENKKNDHGEKDEALHKDYKESNEELNKKDTLDSSDGPDVDIPEAESTTVTVGEGTLNGQLDNRNLKDSNPDNNFADTHVKPNTTNGSETSNQVENSNLTSTPSLQVEVNLRMPSISSSRNDSQTGQQSTTSITTFSATVDNMGIFKNTFELILNSKESKKNEQLKSSVQKALDSLNALNTAEPRLLLEALKITCESSNNDLKSKAVDTFAKLFDFVLFNDEEEKVKLTDQAVDIISACFDGEGTDPEVELQVVRALMHSILLMPCHGASLLKAVRQIYNIFIFSLSARNQSVAQGILTQVIGAIFRRIDVVALGKGKGSKTGSNTNFKTSRTVSREQLDLPIDENKDDEVEQALTLRNLENINDSRNDNDRVNEANQASEKDEDLAVKDAFLIFRAMCKLSVKPLESDTLDMRSHSVRSKLLSLHIIHTILREHIEIFLSPDVVILSSSSLERTRLINTVRQYICLSLSRNAASSLAPVFELSLEIFWIIISNLRSEFKREIPVFLDEIYFPVAEMKTSTPHQKRYLLSIIERLCNDSRCIIEFYLNYDCDSRMPNIYEKIVDYLTRLSLIRVEVTSQQKLAFRENKRRGISVYDISKIANLTSSTMSSKPPEPDVYNLFPLEYALKMTSIGCIVASLRSLYSWAHKGINSSHRLNMPSLKHDSGASLDRIRTETLESSNSNGSDKVNSSTITDSVNESDDPEQFENLKQRKKAFLEGIRQFNQKGKKGIKYLLKEGFITSDDPKDIASFLLETDGIDKASLGEFLGEGEEQSIAIMHAFVEQMDFTNSNFVDSMRRFLQAFRLPGEGQKIDRFMLKFAERYVSGNPTIFANADTAYILAYSIIMLNTDLHSRQVKNRMTYENFVANNSGIDDGNDLPREFLQNIYDEILNNEIKLQSEQHAALLSGDIPLPSSTSIGFFGGRDINREAYIHASKEMSTKTEKLMRNLGKKSKPDDSSSGIFYAASHIHHVKSIFNTMWMSVLAGLTLPFKEYDEEDVTKVCLEGIKISIYISCMFDLSYARTSFVGALVQFENLNNFEEMKPKNVDAIQIMLEVAVTPDISLKTSWIQILTAISQLERLQLIAQGVDQDSIPDVSVARLVNRGSIDSSSTVSTSFFSLLTGQPTALQAASNKFHNQHLNQQVAQLLTKTELEVSIDKVFTNSASLSGESIVDFVKALSEVSSEEIESSGASSNPRMFSLQKVVDICYYNMSRIRLEWSKLWSIMEETFNQAGCNPNLAIAFFALDSLRQLSMRFLEIDELSHFKFQKEFLKPFEHVMIYSGSLEVKDMVLECINNMILARANKIKSGWKTIFGVLAASARENKESLVMKTFKMANWINKEYIDVIHSQECFADLVVCFTELAKNEKFQKVSLLSLDVLLKLINQVAKFSFGGSKGQSLSVNGSDEKHKALNDKLVKLWFPILFGFHDIIMSGKELEVRSRALSYLFELLLQYGQYFEYDFWVLICHQLLFPIFGILNTHWSLNAEDTSDTLSVWLSTTLIQALKSMITLFTHYFESLSKMLTEYFNLIISCICQENDTIARIGRECLFVLLIDNATKFNTEQWSEATKAFSTLFDLTTAKELFTSDPLRNQKSEEDEELVDFGSKLELNRANGEKSNDSLDRKNKEKSSIVVKSVLQLLLIQTLSELFENDAFYEAVPFDSLVDMGSLLKQSYNFAKRFNDDYDLRVRLWNAGIIERLPNLLKQESSSSAVYINIMFRMYCDDDKTNSESKKTIMSSIIPLCNTVTERYSEFDESNQQRNISTWRPVIVEIFQGYVELDDEDFILYAPVMYTLTLRLLSRNMTSDLRSAIRNFLSRVGEDFIKANLNSQG
ncbi:uncharacterized protein PRCAT00005624001 [Priceomyces carsonii]|uniref:uncharacterized protein n=1 Tax=Priceomyces carsonii TaxID=28549 RepID=UPI002ED87615|nr:unnamed protein product [Priceomyces carsonii]